MRDLLFFSTCIATGQDGGLGSHLLVDAVLQASQVEVGISRKRIENNGRLIGNVRDRQCEWNWSGMRDRDKTGQTSKETKTVERTYKLKQIKHEHMIYNIQ
jgi:hypothetical protein